MKRIQLFNNNWLYRAETVHSDAPDDLFEPVTLPHSNKIFDRDNIDNREYQFVSTYRKKFPSPQKSDQQRVYLDFDGVMLSCEVYLNNKPAGRHSGGFTPFSVDLTDYLKEGDNILTVHVDSAERPYIPPFGLRVDYLTFGGIYRDVYLRIVDPCHIDNIFLRPQNVLRRPRLDCDVQLSDSDSELTLKAALKDKHGRVIAETQTKAEGKKSPTTLRFPPLPPVDLWALDQPALYTAEVSLFRGEIILDTVKTPFGFREAEFRSDGKFYLNGTPLKLFGLNRHQTYPYIGAAAPARLQRQDADILKYELGCNVVRTSHYPQSPHFLRRCDEIGLLVFEEMTGWQHIGNKAWQKTCLDEIKKMIERDRNHPSVMLWGVRVNESKDNDDFYTQTNVLAHRLDPLRQTSGVRDFLGSSFLEDVYGYNNFSDSIIEPTEQPHLITEFAGHTFPTKIWDHEDRLIDHALLHARIQNLQMGHKRIAGAIGWCAFDYATHIEFGSGNRICYHGVMDMFRLPKWAAYFYKSQQSPSKTPVLQAATHWTMGDRSGGEIKCLTVFSNCDEIEVFVGETSLGKFKPDTASYAHLPHPPFTITGLEQYSAWGQSEFYDLRLAGFLDGRQVAEQRIDRSRLPRRLELTADTNRLYADGADMTRLVFRITDQFGNPLPYATKVVTFDLEGEADLIGENPFPLIGGQAALYVKARHRPGSVVVRAHTAKLPEASTTLEILPPGS